MTWVLLPCCSCDWAGDGDCSKQSMWCSYRGVQMKDNWEFMSYILVACIYLVSVRVTLSTTKSQYGLLVLWWWAHDGGGDSTLLHSRFITTQRNATHRNATHGARSARNAWHSNKTHITHLINNDMASVLTTGRYNAQHTDAAPCPYPFFYSHKQHSHIPLLKTSLCITSSPYLLDDRTAMHPFVCGLVQGLFLEEWMHNHSLLTRLLVCFLSYIIPSFSPSIYLFCTQEYVLFLVIFILVNRQSND